MPDVLALLYVQPQIEVIVTSEEGSLGENAFVEIATGRPNHEFLDFVRSVNVYKFNECEQACTQTAFEIVQKVFPDTDYHLEWTFAIGSAPKVTRIAAYEVAKRRGIPCLVLDTQHEKFISLVKELKTDIDVAAFVLLAELHGRIGHFPSLIRLRPKDGPVPTHEVAELLNLQAIREEARKSR